MTPDEFVQECRQFIGTPFKHCGRVVGGGVDCIGVPYVVGVRNHLFPSRPEAVSYSRDPDGKALQRYLDQYLVRIHNKRMQAGDILLFRFVRYPQHVGVYTGKNLIHSYEHVGKCVEHGMDERWHKRLVAVYRIPEFCR